MDEYEARSWLCAELPELRRAAVDGRWTAALDQAVGMVKRSGVALDAVALLDPGLLDGEQDAHRGARPREPYLLAGMDARPLVGDYVCPNGWCDRRSGRDSRDRPPVCDLYARPMRFAER
ncbi:hypothetical protein [Nonomuraea lactucae]|uniref:hypothetical protein n=1 Tax=Nonomuraea lactucae TaxID=2249762 RepID=UPI000DE47800|nr:hypothetical protein [Nonomuraea lactucae]